MRRHVKRTMGGGGGGKRKEKRPNNVPAEGMTGGDGVPAQERRLIHKSGFVVRGGVPRIVADVAWFTRGELLELREEMNEGTLGRSTGDGRMKARTANIATSCNATWRSILALK